MVTNEHSRRVFVVAVIFLATACIVGMVLGLAVQVAVMRDRALGFAEQSARHINVVSGDFLDDAVGAADITLRNVVQLIRSDPAITFARLMPQLAEADNAQSALMLIDADGRRYHGPSFPNGLAEILAIADFTNALDSQLGSFTRTANGSPYLLLSRRLENRSGPPRGVAVVAIPLGRFDRILRGGESSNQAALYQLDGHRVSPVDENPFPPRWVDPQGLNESVPGQVLRRLANADLMVGTFVNRDEALKWWRRDLMFSIPFFVVFVMVLAAGAVLLVTTINRNFRHHVHSMSAMRGLNADLERQVAERTAALQVARCDAEKASHAKSRFLAAAAHDLRQPMQALMMFIDELSYRTVGSAEQTVVEKVEASARSLSNLLNGLLDIGAIDSGVVAPRRVDLPLAPILDNIESRFRGSADAKDLALTVLPTRASVHSDPVLLTRILSNLVSNAVRYTERGRILVGCRRRGDEILLQVLDTGIGIDPKQLPLIFEEYYQVSNSGRDRRQGTGLGLAIVERLAGLLGHRVEVSSEVGRGSTFTIRLPLAACPAKAETSTSAEQVVDGGGALVVIVEDDAQVRQAIARSLKNRHYAVLPSASGREAIDLMRWAGRPAVAIVADFRLACGENGVEVIAALRALYPNPTAAILLTGEQRLDADIPDDITLLRKPVVPSILCATIERLRAPQTV